MRIISVFLVMAIMLISCVKEGESSQTKGEFKVELLFEVDGCKVYRFRDGRYVYFSDCRGTVGYQKRTQNGKNSSTVHYIDTVNSGK